MWVIYRAMDLTDASLLRERLSAAGIQSGLRNDLLQGALGELPLTLRPEVYVLSESDVAPSRQLVAEFEAALERPLGPEILCPHCGEENPANFEMCWKCRRDLPPPAQEPPRHSSK
jgi:hypothetical protein